MFYHHEDVWSVANLKMYIFRSRGWVLKLLCLSDTWIYLTYCWQWYYIYLEEKLCIMKAAPKNLLNKRSEITSKCQHRTKFSIVSIAKISCDESPSPSSSWRQSITYKETLNRYVHVPLVAWKSHPMWNSEL